MLHIGCHLSVANGYAAMGRTALELQADTFQFFTRNPRGASAKEIDPADAEELNQILRENHFAPLVAHAPYTHSMIKPIELSSDHGTSRSNCWK